MVYIKWSVYYDSNMGKTMPCLPPMTGNGKHITTIYGDLGDGFSIGYPLLN